MSGPKSAHYEVSAAEVARREEERRLRLATSRFRVLSEELEALTRVAVDTAAEFGESIVPTKVGELRTDAAGVEAQNDLLVQQIAETRQRIQSVQTRRETERVRRYLSTLEEIDVPNAPPTGHSTATPSSARGANEAVAASLLARAANYIAALEPGAELSERAIHLGAALTSTAPELGTLIARDLQAEIGLINRAARRRAAISERLRELAARADALGDRELMREVLFARGQEELVAEPLVGSLEDRVSESEGRAAAAMARSDVLAAVENALLAEGYDVLAGFDTAVPQDGVLVRKPGLDHHAWRMAVRDQSIEIDVVRTMLEADPSDTSVRDIEAERELCADLPAVLNRVGESGVEIRRLRQLAPGDVPVKALPNARPAEARPTAKARKPKERHL